jgi:hypothetical protein
MIRSGHRRPETGDRCSRCHRTAPRSDGISCGLCAPHGATTIDENGVTHDWNWPCRWLFGILLYPIVSDKPIDCMACLVRAARRL